MVWPPDCIALCAVSIPTDYVTYIVTGVDMFNSFADRICWALDVFSLR